MRSRWLIGALTLVGLIASCTHVQNAHRQSRAIEEISELDSEMDSPEELHSRWKVKTLTDVDTAWISKGGLYPQDRVNIEDITHRERPLLFDEKRQPQEKKLVAVGGYIKITNSNEPDGDIHLIIVDDPEHPQDILTLEVSDPNDPQSKLSHFRNDFVAVRKWIQDHNLVTNPYRHVIVTGVIFFDPLHEDLLQSETPPYHKHSLKRVELHPLLGIREAK